jgi:glutathione reductase (NADPH)
MKTESKKEYDLIVIGAGSGGLAAAQRAAEHKQRVAIIEMDQLGGTCVNRGCIPKKIYWYAAEFAYDLKHSENLGFEINNIQHNWQTLQQNSRQYIEKLNQMYRRNLSQKNIEIIAGQASFRSAKEISVGGKSLTAKQIIVACGAIPVVPDLPGAELGITSDDFFELKNLPKKTIIVGSGYIAVELAGILNSLGSDVKLLARKKSILRKFDQSIQSAVINYLVESGIEVNFNTNVLSVNEHNKQLRVQTDNKEHVSVDALLWAVGRKPLVSGLGLERTKVIKNKNNFIKVDQHQTTNEPNIHAIGDVVGNHELTPVAIAAGRILSDRLFSGKEGWLEYKNIPTVIFAHPPVGTVGINEEEARATYGNKIKVYEATFVSLRHSLSGISSKALVKLVCLGQEETVIGCHVVGQGADELLQGFAVAVKIGARKKDLDNTVAIHPTLAEELVTLR